MVLKVTDQEMANLEMANKVVHCMPSGEVDCVAMCPFQQREVGIIPVRYALDDMDEKGQPLHPFPDKDSQWQGRFSPKQRHYTLRQLRDGWLYVYDETDETFHEYQVKGYQFTKIDWSDNEAGKPANQRGTKGTTQSCLVYPVNNTLYFSFAHLRWTWRLCEHMRSHAPHRSLWMRKLDVKQFSATLQHPHAGLSKLLGDYVADIESVKNFPATREVPSQPFSDTCTPLRVTEEANEAPKDEFNHIAVKPGCWDADYRADLPEQNCGLFIALDDPLADLTDLFLPLATEVTGRAALLGDEENIHKIKMAELTRSLGRVRLEEDEQPEHLRDDPIQILALERDLADYLATRAHAETERSAQQQEPQMIEDPTFLQDRAQQKLKALQENFHFTPTSKHIKNWQQHTVFTDEVDWQALDTFVAKHSLAVKGRDEAVLALYDDFLAAINLLGADPLVVGIDNQDEDHISYLMSLMYQYLVVLKQAAVTEQAFAELEKSLSQDSPENLLAMASFGFSEESKKELGTLVDEISKSFFSDSARGDMVAFSGAIANWGAFSSDARVRDKAWFKALKEPVQLALTALQKAVAGRAKQSWRAMSDMLLPNQISPTTGVHSLKAGLRLLLLESVVNEQNLIAHNPNYPTQLAKWRQDFRFELAQIRNANGLPKGKLVPKNHRLQSIRQLQQRIQHLFNRKIPEMLVIKHEALNRAAKQLLEETLTQFWQQGNQTAKSGFHNLGGAGSVVALLNIWNTLAILEDLRYTNVDLQNWHNEPAVIEAIYSSGYMFSAVSALFMSAAWSEVVTDDELLEKSIKDTTKKTGTSQTKLVQNFSKAAAGVAAFGFIAASAESWDSYTRLKSDSLAPMERFGYSLKIASTGAQAIAFGGQLIAWTISRLGWSIFPSVAIGSVLAPWILTTLAVASILYLVAIVVINRFKRSELEKWLLHSTWGKKSLNLEPLQEITRLEQILHRPQVRINHIEGDYNRNGTYSGRPSSSRPKYQQVEIIFPPFAKGETIGLQIARIARPNHSVTHRAYSAPQPERLDEQQPERLDEQQGQWQEEEGNPVYRFTTDGNHYEIHILITLPYRWHPSEQQSKQDKLGYIAYGTKGDLKITPAQNEYSTRTMIVGGTKGEQQ